MHAPDVLRKCVFRTETTLAKGTNIIFTFQAHFVLHVEVFRWYQSICRNFSRFVGKLSTNSDKKFWAFFAFFLSRFLFETCEENRSINNFWFLKTFSKKNCQHTNICVLMKKFLEEVFRILYFLFIKLSLLFLSFLSFSYYRSSLSSSEEDNDTWWYRSAWNFVHTRRNLSGITSLRSHSWVIHGDADSGTSMFFNLSSVVGRGQGKEKYSFRPGEYANMHASSTSFSCTYWTST